ncbi:MAG: hypothetical protein U1E25_09705 [Methylocystis sp.]
MEWEDAQATGARLMQEQARQNGFVIERPLALYHLRDKGLYEYRVRSSRDIGDKAGSTSILFDSRSGELKTLSLPTGQRSDCDAHHLACRIAHGQSLRSSLSHLRLCCLLGLVITMLSVTGVYIWWKKRLARLAHVRRVAARRAPAERGSRREFDADELLIAMERQMDCVHGERRRLVQNLRRALPASAHPRGALLDFLRARGAQAAMPRASASSIFSMRGRRAA